MKLRRLLAFAFLLFTFLGWASSMNGLSHSHLNAKVQPALAQGEDPEPEPQNATPEEPLVEPEKPGDTTILLIAAIGLVLIVLAGILWRSRK
jgi:hypothetical protein